MLTIRLAWLNETVSSRIMFVRENSWIANMQYEALTGKPVRDADLPMFDEVQLEHFIVIDAGKNEY